jgi:hypothetical protein
LQTKGTNIILDRSEENIEEFFERYAIKSLSREEKNRALKLLEAQSNVLENGAQAYEIFVKPGRIDLLRVGAHYAVSSLFEEYPALMKISLHLTVLKVNQGVLIFLINFSANRHIGYLTGVLRLRR